VLRFTSANITSAGSIKKLNLQTSHIWCIQEHKLMCTESISTFKTKQASQGWCSFLAPAILKDKAASGGVGFLWKPCQQISAEPISLVPGRLAMIALRTARWGVIHIYSVYGHSGNGDGYLNTRLFDYTMGHAMAGKAPFILAGDWNMGPMQLAGLAHRFPHHTKVLAPPGPTCFSPLSASTMDMFVIHPKLTLAVHHHAETDHTHRIATHIPVSIELTEHRKHGKLVVLKAQAKVLTEMAGPHLDWEDHWTKWAHSMNTEAPSVLAATHTQSSGEASPTNDQVLQLLFDQWCEHALPELEDKAGMTTLPDKKFVSQDKAIDKIFQKGRGSGSIIVQSTEWLVRRLVEISAHANTKRDCSRMLKLLVKEVANKTELKEWLPTAHWLKKADTFFGLHHFKEALQEVLALSRLHLQKSLAHETTRARHEWEAFVNKAGEGGASWAHKWTKPPDQPPLYTATIQGKTSSAPQHLLQAQVQKWSQYWGSGEDDTDELTWEAAPMPAKLTADKLRAVAKSFQVHTSARDGWHPRLFGKLSTGALTALANVYCAVEYFGDFPPSLREVLVKLIPKAGSQDTRPIGLYKGFFRIWSRARAELVREWVTTVPEYASVVNMLPGRCTSDAVWRAQVLSTVQEEDGLHSAEVLWDIRKCYENVLHSKLKTQAAAQKYPMPILRVSLSSYRWGRSILFEHDMLAKPVYPKAGLVAGSSMATYEIAVLMQKVLSDLAPVYQMGISIHIDDLSVSLARSTVSGLVQDVGLAAAAVRHALEGELSLPIADSKSQLLGSSQQVDDELQEAYGNTLGVRATTARRLGIDHALRKVKHKPVFQKRWKSFLVRKKLIQKLGRTGKLAKARVYTAGMLPSILYGAECNTPPLKVLTKCRNDLVKIHGLQVPGVAHQLALLALSPQSDPTQKALEAALFRWHKEVWLHTHKHGSHGDNLSLLQLQKAMSKGKAESTILEWGSQGPVFAALRAARAVGWEFNTAIHITSHTGEVFNLREGSPAMLRNLYRQRWVRVQGTQALGHRLASLVGHDKEAKTLEETGIDLAPITRCLTSKGKHGLNLKGKRCLLKFLSATGDKHTSTVCTKCGQPDSTHHRLWDCLDPEVTNHRQLYRDDHKNFSKWLDLLSKDPAQGLSYSRGWFPAPQPHILPNEERHVIGDYGCEDLPANFKFEPNIPIYADGSGYYGDDASLATAGLALLQHKEGVVTKSVQVCLPFGIPPTAAVAEHICVTLANKYTDSKFEIVTDCGSVYKSGTSGADYALNWARPMAGFWVGIRLPDLTIRKTKAHRSRQQAEQEGDLDDWLGNDLADGLAKEAASFGTPPAAVAEARQLAFLRRVQFYHMVASTLSMWQAQPPSGMGFTHKPRKKATTTQHSLVWLPFIQKWACRVCQRNFRTKATSSRADCKPINAASYWQKSRGRVIGAAIEAGHTMWVCSYLQQPGSLLFCNVCGCYAQVKAVGLWNQCLGQNHTQRFLLTKFIQQGVHPTSKALLGKPRRLPGIEALPFPSTERRKDGGGLAKPGAQVSILATKSQLSQPVGAYTGDDAEEAFCLSEDSQEDHEEGFLGLDD
jgi:hypothetical protein